MGNKLLFVHALLPVCDKIKASHGIPPRIPIAHAAHESRWGLSKLAVEARNLFGVKPSQKWLAADRPVYIIPSMEHDPKHTPDKIRWWNHPGDILEKKPDGRGGSWVKVKEAFRSYASLDDSVLDWVEILSLPLYKHALEAAKLGDLVGFAAALQRAGWGNDPNYAASLTAYGKEVIIASIE